jgi:hypothetical protein
MSTAPVSVCAAAVSVLAVITLVTVLIEFCRALQVPSARFDAPPIEGLAVLTLPILGAEDFTEPPLLNGEYSLILA